MTDGMTRGALMRRGALATGAAAAGVGVITRLPHATAASDERDAEVLRFALLMEDLQAAFYADAVKRGALSGELLEYAQVVGGHEREHAAFVRKALGSGAPKPPQSDFGDATTSTKRFTSTAIKLEDLGVAAYDGAATSLSPGVLAAAGKIVSVEARHAAWIRDIAGKNPAPRATDRPLSADAVTAAVKRTGFIKTP
jgi:Ferritin-like domain